MTAPVSPYDVVEETLRRMRREVQESDEQLCLSVIESTPPEHRWRLAIIDSGPLAFRSDPLRWRFRDNKVLIMSSPLVFASRIDDIVADPAGPRPQRRSVRLTVDLTVPAGTTDLEAADAFLDWLCEQDDGPYESADSVDPERTRS